MADILELNERYKLESLSLLPDYCLQEIFSREVKNTTVAKIIFLLSDHSRQKVLENLNQVRADRVESLLTGYKSGELESSLSSFEKVCESLLDRVQELKDSGVIQIPSVGLDESFFSSSSELSAFSDTLPKFNFYHNDLHDLISWWNLAAKNLKSLFGKRVQAENIILERLDDEFSSKIFAHAIDDLSDKDLSDRAEELSKQIFESYEIRLNLIESFFMALIKNSGNKTFATNLACNFENEDEMVQRLIKHGPLLLLPAIKDSLPPEDIAMSLFKLKYIFTENGFEEMDKFVCTVNEHSFKKSLSIIRSNMTPDYAKRIIRERKKAQLVEIETKLKMITDAVICIRNNISSYIMLELMSSYTVYDFEE